MSMGHTIFRLSCDEKKHFTQVIKLLPCLPIYNITTSVTSLINNFRDRSSKRSKQAITLQGKVIRLRLRKYHRFHYTASLYKTEYNI